jgi:hypothetical protein
MQVLFYSFCIFSLWIDTKSEFDSACGRGDNPHMKLMSDDRCRVQSKDLFKPNTPYDGEKLTDGRIMFVELVPKETARAKLVRRDGRTYLMSEKKLTHEDVVVALTQFP